MTDVALLNPKNPDAACTVEILGLLRTQLETAERHLTTQRAATYEDYTIAFTRAETLRKMLLAAEDIYGRRFRI
jgi:hypothetical protein